MTWQNVLQRVKIEMVWWLPCFFGGKCGKNTENVAKATAFCR